MKRATRALLCLFLLASCWTQGLGRTVNVKDFGAKGNGKTLCTQQLQRAIDACSRSGGGQVVFDKGRYLTGTIHLKDRVTLNLKKGAVLLGSVRYPQDYPLYALVFTYGATDVGVTGEGVITMQARTKEYRLYDKNAGNKGAHAMAFDKCTNVHIDSVTFRDVSRFSLRLIRCDSVRIKDITIDCMAHRNNDGIDLEARNAEISHCDIQSDDDAICLKSEDSTFRTENIYVHDCTLATNCNAIKMGTDSYWGFRNVRVERCKVRRPRESVHWDWSKEYLNVAEGTLAAVSGIAIECADGGTVEGIRISDIEMEGIITPIFICLNKRHGGGKGVLRDVEISNVKAKAEGVFPCFISGIPGSRIEKVTLRNISVEDGGGGQVMKERVRENLTGYPENRVFGKRIPAGGLYVRHADGITVDSLTVSHRSQDHRPTIVADDVRGMDVTHLETHRAGTPAIEKTGCRRITLDGKRI